MATLPSITKVRTSLVLSRAQFDRNTASQSVAEVIKHLERTTEVKCERVTNQGSNPTAVVRGDWPSGVVDVRVIDRKTIRVDFDAKRVGARDLVQKSWLDPMTLASPRLDPTLHAGFRGDGTNDAVALAQASVGVHVNEGTDVAKSAADIVLMRPSLAGVLIAIAVSRRSNRRIMFNFGWSFVYNIFAILLAAGALVHVRIPPEFAGLGELVSVLPVVAAGLLLKWYGF